VAMPTFTSVLFGDNRGFVLFGAMASVVALFYFVGEKIMDNAKKVCFIGNRTINETKELKLKLTETVERLITEEKADTFLFGSKSLGWVPRQAIAAVWGVCRKPTSRP